MAGGGLRWRWRSQWWAFESRPLSLAYPCRLLPPRRAQDAHCIVDNLPLTASDAAPGPAGAGAGGAGARSSVGGGGGGGAVAHSDEGWRASLYGVYDGHSGAKAAAFLRTRLSAAVSQQLRLAAGLGSMAAGNSMEAGESAASSSCSAAAPHSLAALRRLRPLRVHHARAALERAFLQTDAELLARQADGDAGSCAAVALVTATHVVTAHAGDCRVVLWRDGVAVPLTSDHRASAPHEKQRIEGEGGFVAYGRVLGQLAVSRSFGDRAFKHLDVSGGGGAEPRIAQLVTAFPDVTAVRWQPGDYLVLACDGVWDVMSDQEVPRLAPLSRCAPALPRASWPLAHCGGAAPAGPPHRASRPTAR